MIIKRPQKADYTHHESRPDRVKTQELSFSLHCTYWSLSNYRTPAVIGHHRIVGRFSAHARIASISPGGRGIVVNRKIRRNKLADDQEIDMLT